MAFKDNTLTFDSDGIITDTSDGASVCAEPSEATVIYEKVAEFICQSKGDILEIGFGMGICSDYIQAQGVNSHTIIEIHPQVIEKLNTWASGKSNVTVVEGDWNSVSGLGTYDGILLDTFKDDNWSNFKTFALAKGKTGAEVSYWNVSIGDTNEFSFDNISFEEVSVTPVENSYVDCIVNINGVNNIYYIPKVII